MNYNKAIERLETAHRKFDEAVKELQDANDVFKHDNSPNDSPNDSPNGGHWVNTMLPVYQLDGVAQMKVKVWVKNGGEN